MTRITKKSSEIWHGLQACENVLHLFNDQSKRVMECVWVFVTCLLAIDGSWCDFDTWREHVDTNIIAHRHRTYTYHTHTGMKLQTNIVNAKAMKLTERTSCQVFENKWELCALNWLIKNCWSSLLLVSLSSLFFTYWWWWCVCRSCCWLFFFLYIWITCGCVRFSFNFFLFTMNILLWTNHSFVSFTFLSLRLFCAFERELI